MINFVILRPFAGNIQAGGFFFVSEQAPEVIFKPQPGKNFSC